MKYQMFFILHAILLVFAVPIDKECALDQTYLDRIDYYLAPFNDGITQQMLRKVQKQACLVVIRDHKVLTCMSREKVCMMQDILHALPDMEFGINQKDSPRVVKNKCNPDQKWQQCACDPGYNKPVHGFFFSPALMDAPIYDKVPLFSESTLPECFSDIVLPSYYHLRKEVVRNKLAWSKKEFLAFWRGGNTGGSYLRNFQTFPLFHRHRFLEACRKLTDCDAHFTSWSPDVYKIDGLFEQFVKRYGKKYPPVSYRKQQIYKVLVDIDGNTFSQRFPKLLMTGSAVMKIGIFEDIATIPAKPWVHYLPVKMDFSDLQEKIKWARQNDAELEKIAQRGRDLSEKLMNTENYQCYVLKLLLKYHELVLKGKTKNEVLIDGKGNKTLNESADNNL